ncbi:MAG: helix-turn-helix domain-containing protein [Proteobacteria bacterium]|nr:helix-turn-helix domain-containing protein [Pseudomonadota bacterium]
MAQPDTPQWLTVAEAAKILHVSERHIWRLIRAKQLRVKRLGRCVRIPRKDVEDDDR